MDKKKTDMILIVITVILVGVLIGGFIYDRNSALLARTNYFAINEDPNLELVKMEKAGFLYMRAGYQAKLQIKNGAADDYIIKIAETYGGMGQMFDYTQYKGYEADVLNNVSIRPDIYREHRICSNGRRRRRSIHLFVLFKKIITE